MRHNLRIWLFCVIVGNTALIGLGGDEKDSFGQSGRSQAGDAQPTGCLEAGRFCTEPIVLPYGAAWFSTVAAPNEQLIDLACGVSCHVGPCVVAATWYEHLAEFTGTVEVNACSDTGDGRPFVVYEGCQCPAIKSVGGRCVFLPGETLSIEVEEGTCYKIQATFGSIVTIGVPSSCQTPAASGDFNRNGNIALDDFCDWGHCETGPGGDRLFNGCNAFDVDADGDVDLQDYAEFMRQLASP